MVTGCRGNRGGRGCGRGRGRGGWGEADSQWERGHGGGEEEERLRGRSFRSMRWDDTAGKQQANHTGWLTPYYFQEEKKRKKAARQEWSKWTTNKHDKANTKRNSAWGKRNKTSRKQTYLSTHFMRPCFALNRASCSGTLFFSSKIVIKQTNTC